MKRWLAENLGTIIIMLVLWPIIAAIAYNTYLNYDACHRNGGAFVRGVFGYECVRSAK